MTVAPAIAPVAAVAIVSAAATCGIIYGLSQLGRWINENTG